MQVASYMIHNTKISFSLFILVMFMNVICSCHVFNYYYT